MPNKITKYNLLISCPGDVVDEISIIEKCVQRFNDQFSDTIGITIQTYHWLKSSYPQSGGKPQALLNQQFVNRCDAAIAIFWTRFGTKTDEYGSGTEEEIETLLQKGKQVFLYFSDIPINPSKHNAEQYAAVRKMRDKYSDKGLYCSYDNIGDFEKLLYSHLTSYFLTLQKIEEIQDNKPKLHIQTIDKGKKTNRIAIQKFIQSENSKAQKIMSEIDDLYHALCDYTLNCSDSHEQQNNSPFPNLLRDKMASFREPVEVTNSIKEAIRIYAENIGESINNSFFCLGSLYKDKLSTSYYVGGESPYKGDEVGKKRYHDILLLYKKIVLFTSWCEFEEIFQDHYYVSFVLSNEGTTFDEDIDIELTFDKADIILNKDLPIPSEGVLEYLYDHDESLSEMFAITSTPEYIDYISSLTNPAPHGIRIPSNFGNQTIDYKKEYRNAMDSLFKYQIFHDCTRIILKVNFDYIKQHTSIAFPTKLFVSKSIKGITYKITSKHGAEIIEGSLSVNNNQENHI